MPAKGILILACLLLAALTACAAPQPTETGDAQPETAQATSVVALPAVSVGNAGDEAPLFVLVRPDGQEIGFTQSALEALPQSSILFDGKTEAGPGLQAVLTAAGVGEFTSVTLEGDGALTLTSEQVTAETLLDFTNRGTVKFASTSVPKNDWPKDIVKITVK